MKDYFPLNEGDEWIWEVAVLKDSIPEPYVDGDVNLGEPFVDMNGNEVYDEGIDYFDVTMDLNENGKYDGPDDLWTPGVPYWDRNNNGEYNPPNGQYDEGELFSDLDATSRGSSHRHPSITWRCLTQKMISRTLVSTL